MDKVIALDRDRERGFDSLHSYESLQPSDLVVRGNLDMASVYSNSTQYATEATSELVCETSAVNRHSPRHHHFLAKSSSNAVECCSERVPHLEYPHCDINGSMYYLHSDNLPVKAVDDTNHIPGTGGHANTAPENASDIHRTLNCAPTSVRSNKIESSGARLKDSLAGLSVRSKRVSPMPPVSENASGRVRDTASTTDLTNSIGTKFPAPRGTAAATGELGLVDDLMNIGLPRDQRDRLQTQAVDRSSLYQVEGGEVNQWDYGNDLNRGSLMSYVDKGYTSDTTGMHRNDSDQFRNDTEYFEAVASQAIPIEAQSHFYDDSPIHDFASPIPHSAPEDHAVPSDVERDSELPPPRTRRKHSRKKKERRRRRAQEYEQMPWCEDSRPSTSRAFSTPPETAMPADNMVKPEHQKSSKQNRHRLLRHKSIPGAFSDEEYAQVASFAQLDGRRSAPVFARRGFGGSDVFWKSGQTSIQRTRIQDTAYAHTQGGARPSSAGFFSKIIGRKNSRGGSPQLTEQQRRARAQSVGEVSNFEAGDRRVNKNREDSAHAGTVSGRVRNYGSTAATDFGQNNIGFKPDHRGYHSECDVIGRGPDNSAVDYSRGTLKDVRVAVRQLSAPPEVDDEEAGDVTRTDDFQREAALRSCRGVFRTPNSLARKDLHVKIRDAPPDVRAYTVNQAISDVTGDATATAVTGDDGKPSDEGTGSDDDDDEDDDDDDDDETSSVTDSDKADIIRPTIKTEVYARRWYLLFLFSIFNFLWNAIWSTWGPIAQSAIAVYGWDEGDIAMFSWLGNVPFFFVMFPIAYLMDVKGMRVAMILSCGLMFAGAGMRCIPSERSFTIWLMNGGQLLNGIAGTVPCSAPALLSGLWFPPNQRATATAISTIVGYLGACFSFVVGPLMVPEPDDSAPINNTFSVYSNNVIGLGLAGNSSNTTDYGPQKEGILNTLYIECGVAGILFLLVLIYFPSKPPLPPSISASIPREKYVNGIKMLVRNKQFWVTALAYSVPVGVYEVWQVVLDVNLYPMVSQQTAGWLDFYATLGGCVSGLLVSRFADFFTRQMKLFLLVFYCIAAVSILWFTLVVLDILPFDTASIYAAIIIGGVFLDGGAPLFFELVIEVSYPVGEGVTTGLLQLICAGAGIIFLSLLQIKSIGKQWMNWCYFGVVTFAIPLLFFINTPYGRADIDEMEIDIDSEDEKGRATTIEAPDVDEKTSLLKDNQC